MTLDDFLKNEVDDIDADSSCIYLKLDKDKYDLPFMTRKSQLRNWVLSKFTQKTDKPKKNSQEFEVYKKALKLACDDVRCANPEAKNCDKCPLSFNSNCFSTNTKIDYYLKKARENHEQKAQEDL